MPTLSAPVLPWRVHPSLPIFRLDVDAQTVFYAPGHVERLPTAMAAAVEHAIGLDVVDVGSATGAVAYRLQATGRRAVEAWETLAAKPFAPECLTVYLSNRCNLGCSYCYAAPAEPHRAEQRLRLVRGDEADESFPVASERMVSAAARIVASHCAQVGKPLTLVLHGGGEPTLHWPLLQRVRAAADEAAAEFGITSWAYIATHGALPADRARWLASHFNLIGLSCDGPPSIQNANRPFAEGAPTAALVERTAAALRSAGTPFTMRATITPATVTRQREIVAYGSDVLGTRSIRFEPAYDGRRTSGPHFTASDAECFVEHFLHAKAVAAARGCDLQVSGLRPEEIHGPYCNPLREVLQVTPDGVGTACFLSTGQDSGDDTFMAVGAFDIDSGEFRIDAARAAHLRRLAARIPDRCESCMNVYHCARDCPDVCVMTASAAEEREAGFRCRVHQLLARSWICG
jgi:uncharacterized protein